MMPCRHPAMEQGSERIVARIVNCASHRARNRFLRALARTPNHRGWKSARGGSYYVSEPEARHIRQQRITGVTIARDAILVHPDVLTTRPSGNAPS